MISCGAFTFGHLGPAYRSGIIQMLKNGGLGVLEINKECYMKNRFESEIRALESPGKLNSPKFFEEPTNSEKTIKDIKSLKSDEINKMFVFTA